MSYENENAEADASSMKGVATAPLALAGLLVLFFGITAFADDVMIDIGKLVVLPVAAATAAALGRIGIIATPNKSLVYSFAFVAAAVAMDSFSLVDPIVISTFVFMGISTIFLVQVNRNEEATILLSIVVGFHLAVSYAAGMPELSLAEEATLQSNQLIDIQRAGIGANFFAFWILSIVLGTILAILFRGYLDESGKNTLFSTVPESIEWKTSSEFIGTSLSLLFVNLVPLLWLSSITEADIFETHHYLGSVWALATSIVILFVTFCRTERWHVIGSLVAINWVIYTLAHLVEIGNDLPTSLAFLSNNDTASTWTWFGLTFWLNVGAALIASRGYFGDISPRREPSKFRQWWQANSYSILVGSALVVGFLVRTGWNVIPAMNANLTGLWDMTGGSDPWYMKRVVDYIVANQTHLIFDADRAYPIGGINPRPPLFSWCLALGGVAIEWITGMSTDEAVWWSVALFPAIFGALIVLPVSGLARRLHSNQAGIIAAWLMAFMPGHISHSTFALADHDSFALLFLTLAFYFWVTAIDKIGNERLFVNPSPNPLYLIAGIREMWRRNPQSMANATLAGISFSTVALGWKGFVYGPGILFLAFSAQIILNMFRRRDSLPLTSAALQMMLTTFIIPLPFYIWPEMNLLLAPSGFQPMFYIVGFTFALGWVACSFRDKPWLLILGSGIALFGGILLILWILQEAEIYDGWDILFTGGFYFSKNKIFGTIGEAQAPSRGVLFASYGPVVALIAVGYSFILLWRGARDGKQGKSLLGLWVLISIYMAWSAGRFIFNATPAIAIVGALGISALWKMANFSGFVKEWRRSGIGTPRSRFNSIRPASQKHPMIPALMLVFMLVASQHLTYGLDSGIPRGDVASSDVDQTIYDFTPDIFRYEALGLSIFDSSDHNPSATCGSGCWYMGTFGPGFNGGGWNLAYEWLSEQDSDVPFGNRPAFVSWWDYGFQALDSGEHPTVADNFQTGIPQSGGMLLSSGQEDTLALFITTIAQGDRSYDSSDSGFTNEFSDVLDEYMTVEQKDEFEAIMTFKMGDSSFVEDRSLAVYSEAIGVNQFGESVSLEILYGSEIDSNGFPLEPSWQVRENGILLGNKTNDESAARSFFNDSLPCDPTFFESTSGRCQNVVDISFEISHYYIGDYRYTGDLIEEFDDVSTHLHRTNSRLALSRLFLNTILSLDQIVGLYHDLSTSIEYEVQDYEGQTGETIVRTNDIRYFAVDDRLYPLGGKYYEDSNYHRGQTTGIFYAPTTLSGLDPNDYMISEYITQKGTDPERIMSAEAYEVAYLADIVAQQSGSLTDASQIIRLNDIRYTHTEDFFETMIARIYVGYGSTSLGLSGDVAQPGPTWGTTGTPNSALQNAYPLPGAMMNHFVIANWYDDGSDSPDEDNNSVPDVFDGGYSAIGRANTNVKVVKYYSGATIEGTVELDGIGPIPNARILIERDAFSGEEIADADGNVIDRDQRTYWIPIGTVDADENGDYSFIAPAGKIRVSAFFGEPDLTLARAQLSSGTVGMLQDVATESYSNERYINPITGILGNVSGSQWLAETIVNISGLDGHSNGESHIDADILVEPSFATGLLTWDGHDQFSGEAITNAVVELSPSWDEISLSPITLETSTGTVSGSDLTFQGSGEVTFTGKGTVTTTEIATIENFVGTYTQNILNGHSLSGDGEFNGIGTLVGTIDDSIEEVACNENGTMLENHSICSLSLDNYLIEGIVNATGKFTSNGTSSFTQTLNGSSLSGSGIFVVDTSDDSLESYGTINGSGMFSGEGHFSGEMVNEGTFHLMGAIPGKYDVSVVFSDGTKIDILDGFTVPYSGTITPNQIDVSGGFVNGALVDSNGDNLVESVILYHANNTTAIPNGECSDVYFAPCTISSDDSGLFNYGPVIPGNYTVVLDMDSDGFSEAEISHVFDAEEGTSVEFPTPIPVTYDISFNLDRMDNGTEVNVIDANVTMTSADGSNSDVIAIYDSELGHYYVELIEGEWVLSSDIPESMMQLWERIVVESDSEYNFTFHESTTVTGLVEYETIEQVNNVQTNETEETSVLVPIEGGIVEFYWDGFSTSTTTGSGGVFNVELPIGVTVDAFVYAGVQNKVNGTRFTVVDDMENISMVAKSGFEVNGVINVNRIGNLFSSDLIGWESTTVYATHDTYEAIWVMELLEDGTFSSDLPPGNWSFTTDVSWLNITETHLLVDGENDTIDLLSFPANSYIEIDFFLDYSGDNNVSNGSPVQYDFSIISLNNVGMDYNISSSDELVWTSLGHALIPIEAGSYMIDVQLSNPELYELFGTRILTGDTRIDVGFSDNSVSRSIGFDPEWRVSLNITDYVGSELVSQNVKFINSETGWILSRVTDSSGSIIDHIPEGDWIVVIDSISTDEGVEEGLRTLLTVSEANANLNHTLSTSEMATFTVLMSDEENNPVDNLDITLTSNEGLGKVHLDLSDASGLSEGILYPGSWNVEVNQTVDRTRYLVESIELIQDGLQRGQNGQINLSVSTLVEMSGTIFWDHDDDDDADVGEGVPNATVIMTSDGLDNISLVTDSTGDWNVYVPVNTTWLVLTNRLGFSDESESISMSAPNSVEIELTAGQVEIFGNITHSNIHDFASEIVLELIPTQGLVRDRVTPTLVMENGTWNGAWNASVEPGEWIFSASVESLNLVVMSIVDADISEGGYVDSELIFGGWLDLVSQWIDYDGSSHNLSSEGVIAPEFTISLGNGIEWDAILDESGGISILLPSGTAEINSDFTATQMDREMSYEAANNINIPSSSTGIIASVSNELTFTRIANHEIDSNTIVMTGGNASDEDISDVQILSVDEEYTPVEYTILVDYLGHEPLSTYSVVGSVPGSDGAYWNVSFYNTTGEIWQNQFSFDLGLDNDNTSSELKVRIEPANWSTARSLSDGHTVSIRFSSQGGYTFNHNLILRVPQHHGFELTEEMLEVYGIRPGQELEIPILFTNTGNGDERFDFEFDDNQLPINWLRTGSTSHTIGAFTDTTHTIVVKAPLNATGDEDFTISVSVTDKDGGSYPAIPIHVQTSSPNPVITDVSSSDVIFGQYNTFIITVENNGLVDASQITVNATIRGTSINTTRTIDVAAGNEEFVFIDLDMTSFNQPDDIWIDFILEGDDVSEESERFDPKRYTMKSPAVDDSTATSSIMWVLVAMLLLAGWYLTRGGSRRPGAPF